MKKPPALRTHIMPVGATVWFLLSPPHPTVTAYWKQESHTACAYNGITTGNKKLSTYHLYVLTEHIIKNSIKFGRAVDGMARVIHLAYGYSVTNRSGKFRGNCFRDFKNIPCSRKLEEALTSLLLSFDHKVSLPSQMKIKIYLSSVIAALNSFSK